MRNIYKIKIYASGEFWQEDYEGNNLDEALERFDVLNVAFGRSFQIKLFENGALKMCTKK